MLKRSTRVVRHLIRRQFAADNNVDNSEKYKKLISEKGMLDDSIKTLLEFCEKTNELKLNNVFKLNYNRSLFTKVLFKIEIKQLPYILVHIY